jgi:hypothetical protein
MAKRGSKRKSIIKYLLFTVVALLVTVSLLSLFVFKYANFASNNVVLGANTGPVSTTLLCGSCAGSIVLQKEGTNSKNWGAKCVPAGTEKNMKYVGFISCVVNHKLIVYVADSNGAPISVPLNNKLQVYSGGSKPEKLIGVITGSQWSMDLPSSNGYWIMVNNTPDYSVAFVGGDVPSAGLDSSHYRYIHPLGAEVTGVTVEFKKVTTAILSPVKSNCQYSCLYNTKCPAANVVPSNCSTVYPGSVCCKSTTAQTSAPSTTHSK